MRRKESIYSIVSKYSEVMTRDDMLNNHSIGLSAIDISKQMGIIRNNASSDLNELVEEDKLIKIKGKPTRFINKQVVKRELGIKNIIINECSTLLDLTDNAHISSARNPFLKLIGYNKSLEPIIKLAEAAISYPPNGLYSLLLGESGTGKSYFAKLMFEYAVQEEYFNQQSQFVVFNCADYSNNPQLLISQLFGSVKGAYTGAEKDKVGLIEKANNGILFLDEIHRLPPEGQEMLFQYILIKKNLLG